MKYFLTTLIIIFLAMQFPRLAYAAYSAGLIKGSQSAVYYVAADGKRWTFHDEATYFSWWNTAATTRIMILGRND